METRQKITINKELKKWNLQMENQNWNDLELQIHWNKLEWVNPISRNDQNKYFVYLLKKSVWKIITKLHIGLVNQNFKTLITGKFSKEKVIDDIQVSFTGNKIEHSATGSNNNPYLLQEAEVQEAGEASADAGVTIEVNTMSLDNKNMIISMKKEHNTLEYQ